MVDDPITKKVIAAIQLSRTDRDAARSDLEPLWAGLADDSPFHQSLVAHHLADLQDELAEDLAWDLRALEAGQRCTEADIQRNAPNSSLAAMMPSLHASLAADYLRLRNVPASREHLALARQFEPALADDSYGALVREGIARLADRLEAMPAQSST